jgi:FemAB-related protein (PEP-CTERM system-associated)
MRAEVCGWREGEELAWDEYVSRHPHAGIYHRAGWARVIERAYGHRPVYLWVREGEHVRGVLPLVLFRGPLGGRSLVSLPFLDEGGLCADGDGARQILWTAARAAAREHGAGSIELRQRHPSGLGLSPLHAKVTITLDLRGDAETVWKRIGAKVRNQVRKATSAGLASAWCGVEGLDDFYRVFAENMRDLGSPVHGRRFFARMLEEFAGTARLLLLRDGARTIAGCVVMTFRDTVLVPWASSLRELRAKCPSNLMYWEVMRSACDKGLRTLDFGRSSPGSGTYRFKMQWGGQEHSLHWERLDPDARPAALVDTANPRVQWMVRAWQRLPVPLATAIGPIVRARVSN